MDEAIKVWYEKIKAWIEENKARKVIAFVLLAAFLLVIGISIGESIVHAFNNVRDLMSR